MNRGRSEIYIETFTSRVPVGSGISRDSGS